MIDLIRDLIPHAPQFGLYVAPSIPEDKLRNAIKDYAPSMAPEEVLALFDATRLGSAKDGAVFATDRFIFQNNDLEQPQEVRYEDLVQVTSRRRFLAGRKVSIDVNRGRATFKLTIDFSGRPDAADYVSRFLQEVMSRGAAREMGERRPTAETGHAAVRRALDDLVARGLLTGDDAKAMMDVLRKRG